jgi:D-aminoacyl-tRNA deacylase
MTQFLIVNSSKDAASLNIRKKFLDSSKYKFSIISDKWDNNVLYKLKAFKETNREKEQFLQNNEIFLGLTNQRLIFLDNDNFDDKIIDPDMMIFASRHTSKTGHPSFLVHTTGNWSGDIRYGGKKKELSIGSALMLKAGYQAFLECANKKAVSGFSIDVEVSHHGPTNLKKPLVFMELGSTPKEWHHNYGGMVAANAIINAAIKYSLLEKNESQKIGLGFGGTHYAPQFQKLLQNSDVAISYICPKYYIRSLDKEIIDQMVNKNLEKVDYFILDWSGINSAGKKHLLPLLKQYDIPIKKIKDF